MESAVKTASGKAQIRSNSELLREFATPQGVVSHGRVRPHELISASLDPLAFFFVLNFDEVNVPNDFEVPEVKLTKLV